MVSSAQVKILSHRQHIRLIPQRDDALQHSSLSNFLDEKAAEPLNEPYTLNA